MQDHYQELSYWDFTRSTHSLKKESDAGYLCRIIEQLRSYPDKFPIFENEIFFIIDYTRQRHILMTGNVEEIIGYPPEDFLENGLAFVMDIFNKDDLNVYNKHIYRRLIACLRISRKKSTTILYLNSTTVCCRKTNGMFPFCKEAVISQILLIRNPCLATVPAGIFQLTKKTIPLYKK